MAQVVKQVAYSTEIRNAIRILRKRVSGYIKIRNFADTIIFSVDGKDIAYIDEERMLCINTGKGADRISLKSTHIEGLEEYRQIVSTFVHFDVELDASKIRDMANETVYDDRNNVPVAHLLTIINSMNPDVVKETADLLENLLDEPACAGNCEFFTVVYNHLLSSRTE